MENLVPGAFAVLPLLLMFAALAMGFGRSAVMFLTQRLTFCLVELAIVVGIGGFESGFSFGHEFFQRNRASFRGVTVVLTVVLAVAFGIRQAGAKSQGNP